MPAGKGRKKLQKGTPEVDIIGSDEALAKGILSLKASGREVIKLLTDLNIYEVADLSIALSVSQKINDILHELGLEENKKWTFLEELIFNYMKLKVSRKRMGRKEIANIASFNLWGQKGGKGGGGGGGIKGLIPGL